MRAELLLVPPTLQVDAIVRFSCDLKEERVVAVVDALIDASVIEALILLLETLVGIIFSFTFLLFKIRRVRHVGYKVIY